jgi:REP element-mobilizing transposase RayT
MSRPLRISFKGAVYHVYARGNNKQAIFLDEDEFLEFIRLLRATVKRFGIVCHIYCIMPNHYHVVVETPAGNLSDAIHWLNCVYARWWNRRHARCGHVFQGRFKAQLVQRDEYVHTLSWYLHLNPPVSGLVEAPADWPWSSYRAYAGLDQPPDFLQTSLVYGVIGATNAVDPGRAYRAHMASREKLHKLETSIRRDDRWLGDDAAFEQQRSAAECGRGPGLSRREFLPSAPPLADLVDRSRSNSVRNAQMRRAHLTYGYRVVDISRFIGLNRSTVGKILREGLAEVQSDSAAQPRANVAPKGENTAV